MNAKLPLIINRPELQTKVQRTLFGTLTLALWMLWFYLWLPLLTGFLWIIGIRTAYIQIFRGARGVGLSSLFWIFLVVILLVSYWSNYNRLRYAKSTRRRHKETISKAAVAEAFLIDEPTALSTLTEKRNLDLLFTDSGQLLYVNEHDNGTSKISVCTKPLLKEKSTAV